MKEPTKDFIKSTLFAVILIVASALLSFYSSSYVAGIVITLPIALLSLLFLNNIQNDDSYVWGFTTGLFAYFISTIIFYILYVHSPITKDISILISLLIWMILVIIFEKTISDYGRYKFANKNYVMRP